MSFHNFLKRYERTAFVILLLLTLGAGGLSIYCVSFGWSNSAKWAATSGLLATVTGVVQLEVSGLFEKIFEHYSDEKKYPYGPPSHITREIIDNPDRPIATWFRNVAFFSTGTGFWLIVLGTITQVIAVWL